jgi:hypothetical protein
MAHDAVLVRRVPPYFAASVLLHSLNLFSLSRCRKKAKTKAQKLYSKLFRDREHIGMSHVLIEYSVPLDLD